MANDPLLIASVIHQKWKGLAIKHFEGKGKGMTTHICNCLEEQGEGSCLLKSMFIYLCAGVIATMKFKKNQVVCDYHGEQLSKREGERILETLTGEPSYLFFFKGKGGEPLHRFAETPL